MHESERPALGRGLVVCVVQRRGEFIRDVQRDPQRDPFATGGRAEKLLHASPVHILHDQIVFVALRSEVDDVRDVRVIEHRGDPGFVEKHAHERRILGQVGEDALERDELLKSSLRDRPSGVEFRHAAPRDPLHDLIATHARPRRQRGIRDGGLGGRRRARRRRARGLA